MDENKYKQVDCSVPLDELPPVLLPISLALIAVPMLLFALIHGFGYTLNNAFRLWILVELVLLIIAHEAIHAISWKFASGLAWSRFTFGIKWEALAPYCHATEKMSLTAYRIGAAAPGLLTGVLPIIVALFLGSAPLALIGSIMLSAAIGDIYILWLLRNLPAKSKVRDHDSNAGCIAYVPE